MKIIFTEKDQKEIAMAIAEAESKTSAEIAWKIIDRSSSYNDAPWIWTFIWLTGVACLQIFLQFNNGWGGSGSVLIVDLALCLVLGFGVGRMPAFRRLVISKKRRERRVLERAVASFWRGKVHMTKKRNGLLIYISVLERRVTLVLDEGLANLVRDGKLTNLSSLVKFDNIDWFSKDTVRMKLVESIMTLGDQLSTVFPHEEGDENEVDNTRIL